MQFVRQNGALLPIIHTDLRELGIALLNDSINQITGLLQITMAVARLATFRDEGLLFDVLLREVRL